MDVYAELKKLNQAKRNRREIKRYLLACCEKHKQFRSSGYLGMGIEGAHDYMRGLITWKQYHKYEYKLEGEAFGVEFYKSKIPYFVTHPNKSMLIDLKRVRIKKGMNHKEAIEYLESLTDFIVYVFSYIYRAPEDFPPEKYRHFMCTNLFKRFFTNVEHPA